MKKGKNWVWIMGIVLFVLFLRTPFTYSWDLSDFLSSFQFSVSVGEEYDSNIFLTNKNREHDFITNISTGLIFSKAGQNYGIDLNFRPGYVFYAEHHDLNFFSIDPSTFSAWYALAPRLTFRTKDYIIRSEEGREPSYGPDAQPDQFLLSTVRGQRPIYLRNVVEPSVEYQFGKENLLSVLYRNNIYHIQSTRFQDSMENTVNPKLVYWFDIHNGISLDYYLTHDTFQHSPDQLINGTTPRYTYRFSPGTSIFGEFHFESHDFESPGVDYDVYQPSIGLQYQFSPTLNGLAQVGYFWQVPVRGGNTQGPSFNLSLTKIGERTTYTLLFRGGYTEDYITAQNLGFTKTYALYGTIQHKLTQRMSVGLTGSVARHEYSSDQKDWIWGIWGNASYLILKWLTASLQISYTEDHSNIKIQSWRDYRAFLKLTANFGAQQKPTRQLNGPDFR